MLMAQHALDPVHPGEILREEFAGPLALDASRIAGAAGLERGEVERLLREEVGINAEAALRLGKTLGTTAQFWMNLQSRYELDKAGAALRDALQRITPLNAT